MYVAIPRRNIQKQFESHCFGLIAASRLIMTKLPHILVVVDDREISALVVRYLRSNDCRVTVAGNGRDVDRVMQQLCAEKLIADSERVV